MQNPAYACHIRPSQIGRESPPCRYYFNINMQTLTVPRWYSTSELIDKA